MEIWKSEEKFGQCTILLINISLLNLIYYKTNLKRKNKQTKRTNRHTCLPYPLLRINHSQFSSVQADFALFKKTFKDRQGLRLFKQLTIK